MNRKRRRQAKIAGLVILPVASLLAIWACKTPSFPQPPPQPEGMVMEAHSSDGFLIFNGEPDTVPGDVEVHIFNLDRGFGYYFYSEADGSFISPPIAGVQGERLQFFYEHDGDSSRPMCFVIELGVSPPPTCQ